MVEGLDVQSAISPGLSNWFGRGTLSAVLLKKLEQDEAGHGSARVPTSSQPGSYYQQSDFLSGFLLWLTAGQLQKRPVAVFLTSNYSQCANQPYLARGKRENSHCDHRAGFQGLTLGRQDPLCM